MDYISERIINLSELEKKISDARLASSQLITCIEGKELSKALDLAQVVNSKIRELDNFEFIIEHRKVFSADE